MRLAITNAQSCRDSFFERFNSAALEKLVVLVLLSSVAEVLAKNQ
jgi:hypothetical protein